MVADESLGAATKKSETKGKADRVQKNWKVSIRVLSNNLGCLKQLRGT